MAPLIKLQHLVYNIYNKVKEQFLAESHCGQVFAQKGATKSDLAGTLVCFKKLDTQKSLPNITPRLPPFCIAFHGQCLGAQPIRACKNTVKIFFSFENCLPMSS